MHSGTRNCPDSARPRSSPPVPRLLCAVAGLIVLVAEITFSLPAQQSGAPTPDKPYLIPEANRLPDANAQMKMREQNAKTTSVEAANGERKRQIAGDSAKLLELAKDLKAEVDKTNKDTLSLNVIRKADLIEKLARDVKEKMKLEIGPS